MTSTINLDEVRAAYRTADTFENWIKIVLLPALDGTVPYDGGGTRPRLFKENAYAEMRLFHTKSGIRMTFTIPAYGHNESATYLGSVSLTWSEITQHVPHTALEGAPS